MSLRTKLLLIVTGIILAITSVITLITKQEAEETIFTTQDEHAKNILKTTLLNVENQYKSLLFHKESSLQKRKTQLKNIVTISIELIEGYSLKAKKGQMTERAAKLSALQEIKRIRYDNGVGYIWINDIGRPIPKMITHPTIPKLDGTILDNPKFNCALGVKKNLFQAVVDVCLKSGEGYVDYLWPKPTKDGLTGKQPKLSYVKLFKEWGWVIGPGVYIDDIERDT